MGSKKTSRNVGTTKGYTINYFIDLFTNTTNRQLVTNGVSAVVSPRFGATSVRAKVLDRLLNYDVIEIVNGFYDYSSFGSTPRTRILKALRLRKQGKL